MIDDLLNKYPLISEQIEKPELKVILNNLEKVLNDSVAGNIVEMGCYAGTTSLFISRVLKQLNSNKQFHVYDSFEGLPEKSSLDSSPAGTQFKAGELSVSKKQFIDNYKKASLSTPHIHKGWFNKLTNEDVPEEICFAFLDGDYYDSIKDSLHLIQDKLTPGSVIIIDDYQNEALPGAKRATDEWLSGKNYSLRIEKSLAVIYIPKP
jgi:O-methyltransferase